MTFDLLAGTNQIRNLHATGPLSIALAINDNWTLFRLRQLQSRGDGRFGGTAGQRGLGQQLNFGRPL